MSGDPGITGQKLEPDQQEVADGNGKGIEAFIQGIRDKVTSDHFKNQFLWSFGSVLLSLVVAGVIMLMAGYNPGQAFLWLAVGALSQMDQVLFYATPLILTGLSVALAFRCGLFNIGAEGQLYMGAMAAAVVGYMWSFPVFLHPFLSLLVGAIAGGLWGFVPGLLKAYRGAHEVVTTMMLSYTAILFTSYLVGTNGPFWDGSMVPQTPALQDTAILPTLFGNYIHWGFIIAILAIFAIDFLINRTVLGYEMRAVGHNVDAAEYAGINSRKKMAVALGLSGALSGLAGAEEIMGTYERFVSNWSPGLGWDGITVAVLGNNSPWGVFAGAIFFGALKAGGNTMHQIAHVPIEMVKVIQGLVVLFVAAPRIISWLTKHGRRNLDNIEQDSKTAMPGFIAALFGLAAAFIGLGSVQIALTIPATITLANIAAASILMMVAVLGILVFIATYSDDPRGSPLFLLTAIGWLAAGTADLIGGGGVFLTSFIMGGIAFVLWIVLRMLSKGEQKEGAEL
ncbi:MAG: ABC transporter permease [Candidatus Thorarchaeota archaeon]|jgi:simple sugar transport system permease protein